MASVVIKDTPFSLRYNFELLSLTVLKNLDYFYYCKSKYWYADKFVFSLKQLLDHFQWYESRLKKLSENVSRFDLNDQVRGNGFRSFELIFERFFFRCYRFLKDLASARDGRFFMAALYLQRLRAHVSVLDGLKPGMINLLTMIDENQNNHPLVVNNQVTVEQLIKEYGLLNQSGFYGRCQGFYFCRSMQKTLWGVSVIMASFSDLYLKSGGPFSRAISAILYGVKYILYPELRAQQIVNVAQNSSVDFLKAFWRLSETHFMQQLPKWICPKLQVLTDLWVPAEPIVMRVEDGSKSVIVPVPSSHLPPAPIRCLLMSYLQREGQVTKSRAKVAPLSPALLFHCHGGGFISQTPDTHEIYLRHWAKDLNVPILSVDYSLAPEAPFPRALEEVLLVYAWALKNCEKLGWTGERICFVGDSAGGNILMGIVIKLISMKIRKPDSILCTYSPLILDLVPSPSRLLCWLDPLLPLGFMFSCLDSYVGAMHMDNNEYMKAKEENIRSRKMSSISGILDSSIMFLQEKDWKEVAPHEPESQECSIQSEDLTDVFISSDYTETDTPQKFMSQESRLDLSDYLNQSLLGGPERDFSECILDESSDHLQCDFSRDLAYAVKEKCSSYLMSAASRVVGLVEKNILFKFLVSPFVPTTLFQPKKQSPLLGDAACPIAAKMRRLKVVASNPYISPLFISDDVLKEMPQIYFVSLNFDPCLDDSITFAKRMAAVGKPVVLDMLDGLPHGFLNFLPFSREAHEGSNLCVKRLKEALRLQECQ